MPLYTVKPDSVHTDYLAPTGTASEITALTDGSDTTYCKVTSYTMESVLKCDPTTYGAGERIVSVCPYARLKGATTKTVRARVKGSITTLGPGMAPYGDGVALSLVPTGTATLYAVAAQNGQLLNPADGLEWPLATTRQYWLSTLFSSLFDPTTTSDADRALWYEAGLYVYTLAPATVAAPSAPAGTVTTTQYPTLTATVSAIVESWQLPSGLSPFLCGGTIEFSVYAGSLTAPSGTALFTRTKAWTIDTYIDGSTTSTLAVSETPTVALPNGAMTVFARVSRDHPGGEAAWSSYSYAQFTMNVPSPTAPTVALVASDTNQRVSVTVNAATTSGYDSSTGEIQVQRQVDGVWRDVRGMVDEAVAIGSDVLLGYDYEADRGVTNTYRARVSMWHTVDAVRRYSAWTQQTVTGYANTGWNLKAVDDATANFLAAPVLAKPSSSSQGESAVFAPLDRERPIVVHGTQGGYSGSYALALNGATAIAALAALEEYRGTVYVEDAFGRTRYITITGVAFDDQGTAAAPRREASLEYVEIDSGLGDSTS